VLGSRVFFRIAALAATFLGLLAPATLADETIRIMAANTSSGNNQSYDPGHGNRIFQGLDPDIALIQEVNVTLNGSKNSSATYRQWVNENFGTSFHYHVETGKSIPNGIVSRYPFLATGVWEDDEMPDREFVWARIDLPGDKNLLAISVHLSSGGGSSTRNAQAGDLRTLIQNNKQATDHVVIGGDFNTDTRTESCLATLSSVVVTASPWPADQDGVGGTNASRAKPYDWVAPGSSLAALSTPLVIGSNSFPNGLVFDSREYTPLSAVSPVQSGDSDATGMQHMAVMRAFLIPTNEAPVITQGTSVAVTLSKNNTPTAFSRSLNATDADGDTLSWSILTAAAHGTAGIVAPATGVSVNLSYQPTTNYTGSDSFVVRVSDGQGGTDTITVNLTIQEPPNTAPVIAGSGTRSLSISQNGYPVAFQLTLDAEDSDLDPLAWAVSSPATHGSAGIEATAGHAATSYQPPNGFTGNDSFTVQVSDGRGGTDTVIVQVTVEAAAALDVWTYSAFQPLDPETEATVWGEAADPDQDGYTNLGEFAHGLDPNVPDAAPNLLDCTLGGTGEGTHAILTFKMRMNGEDPALDYALRVLAEPANPWAPLLPEDYTFLSDTDLGSGFIARRVRVAMPPAPLRRFYQLTYERASQ
jgi:endonuclease/exonuclease/phosphatase family metal-dependent hydrolase